MIALLYFPLPSKTHTAGLTQTKHDPYNPTRFQCWARSLRLGIYPLSFYPWITLDKTALLNGTLIISISFTVTSSIVTRNSWAGKTWSHSPSFACNLQNTLLTFVKSKWQIQPKLNLSQQWFNNHTSVLPFIFWLFSVLKSLPNLTIWWHYFIYAHILWFLFNVLLHELLLNTKLQTVNSLPSIQVRLHLTEEACACVKKPNKFCNATTNGY